MEQQPEVSSLTYQQSVMQLVQDCQCACQGCMPTQVTTPSVQFLERGS